MYNSMYAQHAEVAELVYAMDLKSIGGNSVWVRSPPSAPFILKMLTIVSIRYILMHS